MSAKPARGNRSKDRPVYQPWYEGDFWTLRVRRRHPMVRLMYRSVLQGAWDLDPPGWIPNDEETLMNLADCPDSETWLRHKDELLSMFELAQDGTHYTNERQQQELANWREIRRDYARRGRLGGKAKHAKQLDSKQKPSSATNISSSATNHPSNQASTSTKPVPVPSQVEEQSSSAEASPAQQSVDVTMPLNTGEEYSITPAQFDEWSRLYPAVNVLQELRKMRGWCSAHQARRKTKQGINRFINSWLAKEQDKGGNAKHQANSGKSGSWSGPKVQPGTTKGAYHGQDPARFEREPDIVV